MMRILVGTVLLLGVASGQARGAAPVPCQTAAELDDRVKAWTSGGQRYVGTGLALSECLVADDDRFFRLMLAQPRVYDGWLQGLPTHTFTLLDASRRPPAEELKIRMTEIAKRRSTDPSYGSLAKSLAEQLARISVDVLPPALIVVAGAQDVSLGRPQLPSKPPPADVSRDFPGVVVFGADGSVSGLRGEDRWYVNYQVRAPYPAASFLSEVRSRLETSGWEPLPMDWVRWTKPSSFTTGWTLYPDRSKPKGQFHWTAQWRNSAGDLLDYKLNYDTVLPAAGTKVEKPDSEVLRVYASVVRKKLLPVVSLPPALFVAKEARGVNAWQDRGGPSDNLGVRYSVRTPYPAAELVADVSERLAKQGWNPIPARGKESGTPTDSPGWRSGPDDYGRPTAEVFRWESRWRNEAGDQAQYTLTYESALTAPGTARASKPDNADLHVEAILQSKPPATAQGAPAAKSSEGRTYRSPSGSFQIRVPASLGGMETREKAPRPGEWRVAFSDDLCREFMVDEISDELHGHSLEEWVDRNLIRRFREDKSVLKDRKSMRTARGPAVLLRILQPGLAPCHKTVLKDGVHHTEKIDFDTGIYVLYTGNRVYMFVYSTSADNETIDRFTGSIDEVLVRFVEDFEVLKPAPNAKPSA